MLIRFLKFYKYIFINLFKVVFILFISVFSAQAQKYVVVLDAGHGGKDPGSSNGNYIEKKIALNVTLEVGRILKQNRLISVVFTRKKDVFVELHKRASIANTKEATLFVSIHCDSFKPRPAAHGASTYVLGLNGNKMNMEIAKKENAVILLEKDYKNNYDYDPNSPEAVIGLSVLQEENLDASLSFAAIVQSNFVMANRKDRSVKQANFLVLRETVMPSVLIELGFISNNKEAKFLNSKTGQRKMAKAVAKAVTNYVEQIHANTISKQQQLPKTIKVDKVGASKTVVKNVKHTKHKSKEIKKEVVKITQKQNTSNEVKKAKNIPSKNDSIKVKPSSKNTVNSKVQVKKKSETVVKVKKDPSPEKKSVLKPKPQKNFNLVEFRVQVASSKYYLQHNDPHFKGLKDIKVEMIGELYKYYYGSTYDFSHIKEYLLDVKDVGITDAFVVAFKNGQKISLKEALKK